MGKPSLLGDQAGLDKFVSDLVIEIVEKYELPREKSTTLALIETFQRGMKLVRDELQLQATQPKSKL